MKDVFNISLDFGRRKSATWEPFHLHSNSSLEYKRLFFQEANFFILLPNRASHSTATCKNMKSMTNVMCTSNLTQINEIIENKYRGWYQIIGRKFAEMYLLLHD